MRLHLIRSFLFFILSVLAVTGLHAQQNPADGGSTLERIKAMPDDTNKLKAIIKETDGRSCRDVKGIPPYVEIGLPLAERLQYAPALAQVYSAKAKLAIHDEKNEEAQTWLKKALTYCTSKDSMKIGGIYDQLSGAYGDHGQHADAIRYELKALDYFSVNDTGEEYVATTGNLGILYSGINDYPHAAEQYRHCLDLTAKFIKAHPDDTASKESLMLIFLNLADIYNETAQYDKAIHCLDTIIQINKQVGNKLVDGMAYEGYGDSYYNRNLFPEAIRYYQLSKAQYDMDLRYYKSATQISLSQCYTKMGDNAAAMREAKEALELGRQFKFDDIIGPAFYAMGKVYASEKNYTAALSAFDSSLVKAKLINNYKYQADIWEQTYIVYEQMHRPAEALNAYKQFNTIRDSLDRMQNTNQLIRQELEYGYHNERIADSVRTIADKELLQAKLSKQQTYIGAGIALLVLLVLLSFVIYRSYHRQKKANSIINDEKNKSESLLLNILPGEVAEELKTYGKVQARAFDEVSVLFTDFVDFTVAGEHVSAQELVSELDNCFKAFDEIIGRHGIEKIKTVGDAYLAVCGLPAAIEDHAAKTVRAAIEIRDYMRQRKQQLGTRTFGIRVGIHSGNVVAGIVGVRKFAYDIWGDTVNTAARMEQHGADGKVNISSVTYELVKDKFNCTFRGAIEAKNKGELNMYFVEEKEA